MQIMQMLKASLVPRRSIVATLVMVGVVASVMGLTPTHGASNTLAENCANPPSTPTFNYWPVTYDDTNTPFCHDFPAIDAALDVPNPQWSKSQADWDNGLTLQIGQQAAAGLYLHNGAANNLDPNQTTAKNVHVITNTDTGVGSTHLIQVTYTASNAASYTKSFTIHTPENARLEVIPNSGYMYDYQGRLVLDQQNLNLGNSDYTLGDLDACFEYSLFFTYKFKVVAAPPTNTNTTLSIEKKVKNLTTDPNTGRGAVYNDTTTAKKGEKVGYRIAVTNTGTSVAKNVTVSDNGVSGITVDSGSTTVGTADDALLASGWSGSLPGTVNLGDLQPGESRLVKYSGTFTADNCPTLVNTAYTKADNAPQMSDTASVTGTNCGPGPSGNLSISKNVKNLTTGTNYSSQTNAKPNERVNFKLTVANTGNATVNNVKIVDTIPSGLVFDDSFTGDGTPSFSGTTLTVNFGSLAAGQTKTIEFAAKVTATTSTTICNTGTASGDNVASVTAQACVTVIVVIPTYPKIAIKKEVKNNTSATWYVDDNVSAHTGDIVNFRVTVSNPGDATLENAVITDLIPAGLQYADNFTGAGTANVVGNNLTVNLGSIPAGQSKTIEFAAKVTATTAGQICNVAKATGTSVNEVTDNACVTVIVVIPTYPKIAIKKEVKNNTSGTWYVDDSVNAHTGDIANFRITVSNPGDATLENVIMTDVIPSGLQYADNFTGAGTVTVNGSTVSVNLGSIAAGQSKTIEFAVKVTATTSTSICNVAKAIGTSVNEVSDQACITVVVVIPTNPKIAIKKFVKNNNTNTSYNDSNVDVRTGEWVNFKVTVSNPGDATLNNVVMTDVIPEGLKFDTLAGSTTGDGTTTFSGTTFTVNFGSISAGQSKTIEFAAQVLATATTEAGKTICNVAKAIGTSVSEVSDDACVHIYTTPKPGTPHVVLSKKAWNDTKNVDAISRDADRGDYITYTLIVKNDGNADEVNFIIKDDLSEVLPLADIISTNGGVITGNVISYPAITIKPGETITKTFKVRIKESLDKNLPFQLKNTYGNTIIIKVPGKRVYEAPKTGAAGTSAGIFAGLLTAGFVVARKRESILKLIFA